MYRLLPETANDQDEVEMLYDLAFAPGRAALSSYQLRDGVEPIHALCWILRDDYDVVVGAIRYWPVQVGSQNNPILLLGPIAVHPTRQGEGLGAMLIAETVDRARNDGWPAIILVGDPPYYRRFGFQPATPLGLNFPKPVNPDRFLLLELSPGASAYLSGEVTRFDKTSC